MQLCQYQIGQGNVFLFEQPIGASSWEEPDVKAVMNHPEVFAVILDQCMFNLKDPESGSLYKKRTRIMNNCPEMAIGSNELVARTMITKGLY